MASFAYKGRDSTGALVQGVLDSTDANTLATQLLRQSIIPVEIKVNGADESNVTLSNSAFFQKKIEVIDVMMFSRQMNTLLKAGIPIMRALTGLQGSTKHPALVKVLGDLHASLDGGRELSSAMKAHPKVFDDFYVNMIRVGETTGLLDAIFLRMYHHLEFQKFMRDQIKAALRYPSFVITAMAIALVVINIMVIPAFSKVFAGLGADLPFLTKVLLGFSNFMVHYWALMLLGLIGAFFAFRHFISTQSGRYRWDAFKFRIPIAGKVIQKATMARFARTFALAGKSGVPITNGLHLVAQTVDNSYLASKVEGMRTSIERGESILRAATNSGVFNPMVLQMIAVGEESGALDDLMQEIADMYQRDVEYEIKTLGSQIEPILIVFLGALVLVLALGIFLPMWDLGSAAMHH